MAWPHRWAPAIIGVPLLIALIFATAPDVAYLVMLAAHFGPWPVLAVVLAVVAYRYVGARAIRFARRRLSLLAGKGPQSGG